MHSARERERRERLAEAFLAVGAMCGTPFADQLTVLLRAAEGTQMELKIKIKYDNNDSNNNNNFLFSFFFDFVCEYEFVLFFAVVLFALCCCEPPRARTGVFLVEFYVSLRILSCFIFLPSSLLGFTQQFLCI
jgi:hypothetical protein